MSFIRKQFNNSTSSLRKRASGASLKGSISADKPTGNGKKLSTSLTRSALKSSSKQDGGVYQDKFKMLDGESSVQNIDNMPIKIKKKVTGQLEPQITLKIELTRKNPSRISRQKNMTANSTTEISDPY